MSPSPGIAYMSGVNAIGTFPTTFATTAMPDNGSMGFNNADQTLNFNSFRSVSLAAELQPTMNSMTWAGNIVAVRHPIRFATTINSAGLNTKELTGFTNLFNAVNNGTTSNLYTAPVNKGVYTCSLNKSPTFDFNDIMASDDTSTSTDIDVPPLFVLGTPVIGVDSLDSIVFAVNVPAGAAAQSFILKIWQCNEYVPMAGSALYEFSHISPPFDQEALRVYKHVASQLPVAVGWEKNDNFWEFVTRIAGVILPGGLGNIARGLSGIKL
jgi:hypothetical protein